METWTYRQAQPADAPLFAKWVKENPLIDPRDVHSTLRDQNPTCVFLVACCNDTPVSFMPVFIPMHIAHLAFDPKARASQKVKALRGLKNFVTAFALQMGIRQITTLSREDYPIAKWATQNGFEVDDRQLFCLDLNSSLPAKLDPAK